MNCATVFFLLQIYSSVAPNSASSLATAAEVYSHFPSVRLRRRLLVNRRATWSWNPPSIRTMRGVTTQVSAPKRSTDWTTALKKSPYTHGAVPSLLRILVNLCHTALAFSRFLTTSVQSLYAAETTRPKYLKEAPSPGGDHMR